MKSIYIWKTGEREGKRERDQHTLRNVFLFVFFFFSWLEGIWNDARLQKGMRDVDDPFKQNSLQV